MLIIFRNSPCKRRVHSLWLMLSKPITASAGFSFWLTRESTPNTWFSGWPLQYMVCRFFSRKPAPVQCISCNAVTSALYWHRVSASCVTLRVGSARSMRKYPNRYSVFVAGFVVINSILSEAPFVASWRRFSVVFLLSTIATGLSPEPLLKFPDKEPPHCEIRPCTA